MKKLLVLALAFVALAVYAQSPAPESSPSQSVEIKKTGPKEKKMDTAPSQRIKDPCDPRGTIFNRTECEELKRRKAQQSSQSAAVETKQRPTEEKRIDKASPKLMKVKVSKVNGGRKTFTGMLNGKVATFHLPGVKSLPKSGNIINMRADPHNPGTVYFDLENDPTSNLPTICGGRWICRGYMPFLSYDCMCLGNL